VLLPLNDGVPLRRLRLPLVTWALIAVNVAVHLWLLQQGGRATDLAALGFGAIPVVVTGDGILPPGILAAPAYGTLITYQFLHDGWLHIGANMLFLYIFGDNVEDAMGHLRFLVFYLLCGIAGGLAFIAFEPGGAAPLVGASGAISGVVAAYLLLHPRVRVFGLILNVIPVRISALYMLGAWLILQVVYLFSHDGSNVAYAAHVGGAVAGAALIGLFKAPDVALFDRGST
jgi:membrane associated rhomboid family serine protease